MTTPFDPDDLHGQFVAQAATSAIEAIDDAVSASTGGRLRQSTKDGIRQILDAGFSRVLESKTIGDWDQMTTQAIWGLIELNIDDDGEADLEGEIKSEVRRAFANFAEGLIGRADDELRHRRE